MIGNFKIGISSNLEYEELTAEIYWNNNYLVAEVTQESGPNKMELTIFNPRDKNIWVFPFYELRDALDFAKCRLVNNPLICSKNEEINTRLFQVEVENNQQFYKIYFKNVCVSKIVKFNKSQTEIALYLPENENLTLPLDMFLNILTNIGKGLKE